MKKPVRSSLPPALEKAAAEAITRVEEWKTEEENARVYQMALFPSDKRGMPLEFVPCALFAAAQTNHAPYLRGEKIGSYLGYDITFTGRRLTQVHADVLMGVAAVASDQPEGHIARIELRKFLRVIGREVGSHSRQSLRQLLDDLMACVVRITDVNGKDSFAGHILVKAADQGANDDESVFFVEITRDFCKLFGRDLAMVDWSQRLKLKRKPLALWLQLFFSRFHKPISVAELHRLAGSADELRFFRRRLKRELEVLTGVGAISQFVIDDQDVLHVALAGKPLSARFKPSREPAPDVPDQHALQLELEHPVISAQARAEFRALYPNHDPDACAADFRSWPRSQQALYPDKAYLGFAKKWVHR
jgi:hypothetical protein